MSNRLYNNAAKSAAQLVYVANLQGESGITFINDTSAKTGSWSAIQCITACTFSVLTCKENNGADMASIVLAAGATIYGHFSAITLATGSVIAYNS
jgi:hypothetical protein